MLLLLGPLQALEPLELSAVRVGIRKYTRDLSHVKYPLQVRAVTEDSSLLILLPKMPQRIWCPALPSLNLSVS